jgi:hypothetical protein
MITKTFYLGGNNNHVDGSHPTRQRGCKFWYIVIWKDLETVHPAFDAQANNVSIFRRLAPDCKKGSASKNVLVLPVSSTGFPARKCPGAQYKQNSSFTMSISKSKEQCRSSKFLDMVSRNLSGFHNSLICGRWWRQTGSNRRPEACKATALPTELCPPPGISSQSSGIKKALDDCLLITDP